jgi:hypothetical protein
MSASPHVASAAPGTGTFRAIVWKELHEGLKPAAIGFAIVAVGLGFTMMVQGSMASAGLGGGPSVVPVSLFTLTSALVGLMIGRAQMMRERRGDSWAFLTHRPVTRSTLFCGKVLAGVLLYVAATGIPLAVALTWLATPGHRPMPFDARMTLPDIADLSCGLVYYVAGLLITMREARWYASRFLPVGAAFVCSTYVVSASHFWEAIGCVLLGLLVVGTAARGVFIAGGRYEPQPRTSRAALAVTVGLGLQIVGGIALGILGPVLARETHEIKEVRSTGYELTSDGAIVQVVRVLRLFSASNEVVEVKDFNGHPIDRYKDSVARGPGLKAGVISTAQLPLNLDGRYAEYFRNRGYRGTEDILVPLSQPVVSSGPVAETRTMSLNTVSWYFMRRLGLIAAYDNRSSRLIGWMGPDGFSAGDARPVHRFVGPLGPYAEYSYQQPLIAFPDAVYRLDLSKRKIRRVFTAPPGESVIGAVGSGDSTSAMTAYGTGAQFDAVATMRNVYVQSPDGTPQLTVPRDPRAAGYGTVVVSRALLASGAPTFLWYKPAYGTLSNKQQMKATDQITEFGTGTTVVAQYTLPLDSFTSAIERTAWARIIVLGLAKPVTARVASSLYDRVTGQRPDHPVPVRAPVVVAWAVAILVSLISAALTFATGRRYAFDRNRLWLWTAAGFVLGPLGVLLMLSLIEWPGRETCPACSRKRVVARERCEHCGAPFNPPPADGTEIFEPAA